MTTLLIEAYRRASGKDFLEIEDDEVLYWAINPREMTVSSEDKPELSIGNLTDDWEFLQNAQKDSEQVPLMIWHLYPLLIYMARMVILKELIPKA